MIYILIGANFESLNESYQSIKARQSQVTRISDNNNKTILSTFKYFQQPDHFQFRPFLGANLCIKSDKL